MEYKKQRLLSNHFFLKKTEEDNTADYVPPTTTPEDNAIDDEKSTTTTPKKDAADEPITEPEENAIDDEKSTTTTPKNDAADEPITAPEENTLNETTIQPYGEDIALWPKIIPNDLIELCTRVKPKNVGDIKNSKTVFIEGGQGISRRLNESHFYFIMANGTKEKREWLIFSETTKSVYCFVCKLFSTKPNTLITGCSDWKNIGEILKRHDESKEHKFCMCIYVRRIGTSGRIDSEMVKEYKIRTHYWREVLRRVAATVKLLATLGLGFRGHDNNKRGNFMSCIEYLAEFDNFLKTHLDTYNHCGKGNVSYLSNTTCDEFIGLMATHVRSTIINDIKEAKYFSIIVDSTPDLSHNDQLSLIIRYIDKQHQIQESFLCFVHIERHDASNLENIILSTFDELSLDIKNCRGQTYDNAANMSGLYNGLQAKIKNHSKNAVFIPCAAHSLNLIGNAAAESCSRAIHFFYFIQNLFVFFSSSTKRWDLLNKTNTKSKLTLKRISDTRWSARADAILATKVNFVTIKEALFELSNEPTEKPITKLEAKKLYAYFEDYETALLLILWNTLLQRINATNKTLQSKACNLQEGVNLLKSLSSFILEVRNGKAFESMETEAQTLTGNKEYKSDKGRTQKIKLLFDENSDNETILTGRRLFIVSCLNVICDRLLSEIKRRVKVYEDILQQFAIFMILNLRDTSPKQFDNCIANLINDYKDDIDGILFEDEVAQFLHFAVLEKLNTPMEMYLAIQGGLISTFPNVYIILKILLTIPIANASAERSFSVLKRVKNYLRSTLGQDKLSNLAILCIEKEITVQINYDTIIDRFSAQKARKVNV